MPQGQTVLIGRLAARVMAWSAMPDLRAGLRATHDTVATYSM